MDPQHYLRMLIAVLRIRDPVLFDPWIRDPEYVFPGSRIPYPYFCELIDNFLSKKFHNSLKIGPNFFLQHFKNKISLIMLNLWLQKKGITTNFFSPFSFAAVFGSEIQDPEWVKIRDPG
jgi:hypothetical protein